MKKRILLSLLFSVSLAGCATQQANVDETVSAAKQSDSAAVAPKKVVKICKTYAPTGSRLGKKVCRTKEAWAEIAKNAKDALDNSTKPQSNNRQGG